MGRERRGRRRIRRRNPKKGMEVEVFVWKLRFLYGLYGFLWVGMNLWTFF